jgi:uncharacterized protein YdhG (YjbR/CyaY superfamily)
VILAELPSAEERISYRIPTFFVAGRRVVHIAAWKEHLAMYPAPAGLPGLEAELDRHRSGRGTLKFPLPRPLPVELIRAAVAWQWGLEERQRSGSALSSERIALRWTLRASCLGQIPVLTVSARKPTVAHL